MKRYLNLEHAVAVCVQSSEGNEAHVSEEDMSSEDSPWSQEDSGEEYLPDREGPCNLTGENEEEEEEAVVYETSQWRSRNGEILWSAILTPGPTHNTY